MSLLTLNVSEVPEQRETFSCCQVKPQLKLKNNNKQTTLDMYTYVSCDLGVPALTTRQIFDVFDLFLQ